jgi:hypothetical protein
MYDQRTRQIAIDHHLEFLRRRVHELSDSDIEAIYAAVDAPSPVEGDGMQSSVTVQGWESKYTHLPEPQE